VTPGVGTKKLSGVKTNPKKKLGSLLHVQKKKKKLRGIYIQEPFGRGREKKESSEGRFGGEVPKRGKNSEKKNLRFQEKKDRKHQRGPKEKPEITMGGKESRSKNTGKGFKLDGKNPKKKKRFGKHWEGGGSGGKHHGRGKRGGKPTKRKKKKVITEWEKFTKKRTLPQGLEKKNQERKPLGGDVKKHPGKQS